jgi:nucleoside-diphosphate-sugar epimerase
MRILVIGGTGFIGPYIVRELIRLGHQLAVFHRGQSTAALPDGVQRIVGTRDELNRLQTEFRSFAPDVVIDMILSSEGHARTTMNVFRGIAGRLVALSSADVYRAIGVLHGKDKGPLQQVPLTEESDLRTYRQPYGKEALEVVRKVYPWVDDDYDKIPVEQVVMSAPDLPGTVLRLPMTYGPGDPLHRFYSYVKRMDDGRPAILLPDDAAAWRGPRGYVENVAAGVALAATSPQAAGRIYNLADQDSLMEREWVQAIGRTVGWRGAVHAVPRDRLPAHLAMPGNYAQHWNVSTARIRDELGYSEPISLQNGFTRTIAWERTNPPAQMDPKQFDYAAEDAAIAALQPT